GPTAMNLVLSPQSSNLIRLPPNLPINRIHPRSSEKQSHARAHEGELELEARESFRPQHQADRNEHVDREAEGEETGEQTEYEGDAAEELEQSDERAHDAGH